MSRNAGGSGRARAFFDRFVHPVLAAVAAGGVAFWCLSFLVAAAGLATRATGRPSVAAELFFGSGLVGLAGTVTLVACALWLAGAWLGRYAGIVG